MERGIGEPETMEIKYRIAELKDLDEICHLVRNATDTMTEHKIFQWDDLYPVREDFEADIEKKQLYIGMVEQQIAVIYVLNQECDEEYAAGNWKYGEEPFYVIHRLCVNPVFQQKGIAKRALLHIEEELVALGVHAIRLDVFSENPFALKLYHNAGFQKVGYVDWRKGRFYLMEKQMEFDFNHLKWTREPESYSTDGDKI